MRPVKIISLFLGLLIQVGWAAAQPVRIGSSQRGSRTAITVNYQTVAVLGPRGGTTASERAETALRRLAGYASSGRSPHFSAGRSSGGWAVMAGGGVVVLAGPGDAKAAHTRRRTLARRWASSFAKAWATPLLRISPAGGTVAVGSSRTIRIGGVGRGPVRVSVSPAEVASAYYAGGRIAVRGLGPGRATVSVSRDGATDTASVRVMRWAGSARPLTLEVTGDAVPRELISNLVTSEMQRGIRLESGAWSVVEKAPTLPEVWTRGRTLAAPMRVRLAGPGYLPVLTSIPIEIVRRKIPPEPRLDLFYSNNPESVEGPQVLFRHGIKDGTPARLLYHHQNTSSRTLNLAVDLRNSSDQPMRVQVVDGTGDPLVDTVEAGHMAALRFLKRWQSGAGVIVDVPAHGTRRISARRTRPGETASGVMMIRKLQDGALTLSAVAEEPGTLETSSVRMDTASVFPSPDKTIEASYTVGGAWTYVPIGQNPISNPAGLRLDGNYGVMYTVRLRMVNPTSARKTVNVLFEPRAGAARAVMIINGSLTETRFAAPPDEVRVASVSLAPHQTSTMTMVTMPAGGGSYPAALIVHG